MSAVLTKTEYIDLITALLPDNNAREITESIMREMFQKLLLRDRVVLNSENLLFKENGSSDSELQSGDIIINRYQSGGEWYLDFKRFLGGDSEDPGNYVSAIRLGTANITGLQATLANCVKKSFYSNYAFNGSGVDTSIPLNPNGYSEIRITNPALESIAGVDLSLISGNPTAEVPYTGKMYLLKNITGNAITIKHNSEIADIPFYTNDEQNLEVPNKGIIIFTYDNAACEILLTNFSVGTTNNFPYTEITKTELDTLIANSELTKGFYKISGVNTTLYGGTTILVEVLEDNKLPIDAYGLFYNPKYDKTIDGFGVAKDYAIWKDESEQLESGVYTIGQNVIWGGKHWTCVAPTNINTKYIIDKYNLSADYFEEVPFNDTDYNLVLDKIKYDYEYDLIIERNEKNSNVVSFSYEYLEFFDNPIKSFQWGNIYDINTGKGIGNNNVYNSLNENINFTGAYQLGLYFSSNNNQSRLIFKKNASQYNLYFSKESSQANLIFGNNSGQSNLTFTNQGAQYNLVLNAGISQNNLVFNNYQRGDITIYENELGLTFDGNKQATKLTGNQFFTGKTTNDFAQIGDIPKFFSHKLTTPTAYVTGTVSETEVYRLPLPPGSFNSVDVLKIPLMLVKKLGTNGTIQVRCKISTSETMPTGTTDMIFQTPVATSGNQTLGIIKTFFIDNGNIKGTQFTGPAYTDNGAGAGIISEKPFDIAVTNYLYLSVINGSASDQTRLEAFQLINS